MNISEKLISINVFGKLSTMLVFITKVMDMGLITCKNKPNQYHVTSSMVYSHNLLIMLHNSNLQTSATAWYFWSNS